MIVIVNCLAYLRASEAAVAIAVPARIARLLLLVHGTSVAAERHDMASCVPRAANSSLQVVNLAGKAEE